MKRLKEIDGELDRTIAKLKSIINTYDIQCHYDFQAEFFLTDNIIDKLTESQGVYLFEIKKDLSISFDKWYTDFVSKWAASKVENSPRTYKKRAKADHDNTSEWIPLYIGKTSKIKDRIGQHIVGSSSTYSLRLSEHLFLNNYTFRLSVLYLGKLDNYEVISTIIESELRNRINPIVGKQ